MSRHHLFLALAMHVAVTAAAQAPVREEQLLYTTLAYNGKDYSGTFSGKGSDAIYLVAGVDNFLSVRKTFVYFWPITQELKMETSVLDQVLEGFVEISGQGVQPHELEKVRYTYYNKRGEYEYNWHVAKGADADEIFAYYRKQQDAYWELRGKWSDRNLEYQLTMDRLTDRIFAMRKDQKDTSAQVAELQAMQEQGPPEPPPGPDEFSAPPREPQLAYNIDLPAGEYRIRFINPDGTVMQDSERRLILFTKTRGGVAGYEVIPADKWTRPETSGIPGSVLYVNGRTDIFLRPFFQDEFNHLAYEKLIRNDARGNRTLRKWVRIQQVPRATIDLAGSQPSVSVQESPYTVEQVPGAALGYKIVPYEKEHGEAPDLFAYKVAISRGANQVTRVTTRDAQGVRVPGSERQIRVVGPSRGGGALLILALLPLGVMGLALGFRATKLNS